MRPLCCLVLALGMVAGMSAPVRADKFAGAFLEGGAGARALGMGNAYTAVASDPSAIYWNPAGLASMTHHEVTASHEFRFGNLIDYSFFGGVLQVPQRNGRLALGIIRLGIDDIAFPDSSLWDDRDHDGEIDAGEFDFDAVEDADKIRFVNDSEWGFFLSYAQPLRRWQVGGSLKIIRQSVDEFTSFGIGIDLGLLRRDVIRNLDIGLTLHDATSTYLSWSTGRKETISPVSRLGYAYRVHSTALHGSFLFANDYEFHFDKRQTADQLWSGATSVNVNWGLEFSMQNQLALRIGLREESFQAGAGLAAGPLRFEYGVVPNPPQEFDASQRLSISYLFGCGSESGFLPAE